LATYSEDKFLLYFRFKLFKAKSFQRILISSANGLEKKIWNIGLFTADTGGCFNFYKIHKKSI